MLRLFDVKRFGKVFHNLPQKHCSLRKPFHKIGNCKCCPRNGHSNEFLQAVLYQTFSHKTGTCTLTSFDQHVFEMVL